MNIPKDYIRWLMGRANVGMSDDGIREYIRRRAKTLAWTERKILEAQEFAIECMNENRQIVKDFRFSLSLD